MHPLNGILLVDKAAGLTSHDVVARSRRILGLRHIGHAGTLDPAATGLLLLLLGEATKLSDFVLSGDKEYEFSVQLGVETSTLDLDGEILAKREVHFSSQVLEETALKLQGELQLPVPKVSAVKVEGRRLYQYARSGQEVEVPSRSMHFRDLRVLRVGPDSITVRSWCSKGSYVRSWAAEFGRLLGCGGVVSSLRRLSSSPYQVSEAITLEAMQEFWLNRSQRDGRIFGSSWIPMRDCLPQCAQLYVEGHCESLLKNGQISKVLQAQLLRFVGSTPPPVKLLSRETQDVLSLLCFEAGKGYRIRRVFPTA